MFKLVPIEKRLCELAGSYDIIADACGIKKEDGIFLDFRLQLSKLWRGNADHYVYLWFVLIMGVFGLLLYLSKEINPPSRWHITKFFSAPPPLAKKLDLVKRFLQVKAWALLLYAAIFKSPLHMYPWLLVQVLVMILKVITVTINYISRSSTGRGFWTTLNLSFHALSTWIVHKAMVVLLAARKDPLSDYLEIPLNSNK